MSSHVYTKYLTGKAVIRDMMLRNATKIENLRIAHLVVVVHSGPAESGIVYDIMM